MSDRRWLSWVLGAALLAAVIAASLHFAEQRAFLRLLEQARPSWLLAAVLMQAVTYAAQGEVWRRVTRSAGHRLSMPTAFELGVAKLFADQALPSAGVSSSVLIAKALERRGLERRAVAAVVVINILSYHVAYVLALAPAIAILAARREVGAIVITAAGLFLAFSAGFCALIFSLAGRRHDRLSNVARRFRVLRTTLEFIGGADAGLVRAPRVLAETTAFQLAIVVLDAATLWTLIRALGAESSAVGVFAGFMVASLFRTVGVIPGGLGTFEATSVLMLRTLHVDLAVALSATLLFRGLSFWIPMLPGYWLSRRAIGDGDSRGGTAVPAEYWAVDSASVLAAIGSRPEGLTAEDADDRLNRFGANVLREQRRLSRLGVLARQVRSPLLLLLFFAAGVAAATGEWLDAGIVTAIVLATIGIGYSREYRAETAAAALRARVRVQARIRRPDGVVTTSTDRVVPGDIVLLEAGSLVPADAIVLEASDFFVNQAVLTGESFPVQKMPGPVHATAELVDRTNCVFFGTNVRSGTAACLVVATGAATELGGIAKRLSWRPPETEFDRGIRRFGYLLTSAMLVLVVVVFTVHVFRDRSPVETLLFAVALAVGLSPELLPAILSVNLSRGAQMMARQGVLVKRLNAIENLGSMNVLCTDKTGTLTEGVIDLEGAYDAAGVRAARVLRLAALNAGLETGVSSPLDEAICRASDDPAATAAKLGEIPFDFVRKRVTVVVDDDGRALVVTKGAFAPVLDVCARLGDGALIDADVRADLERRYEDWTRRGIRVLAVASRGLAKRSGYERSDETDMTFEGFLTFLDRPREGVTEAIAGLAALDVTIKVISGDSRLVVQHIASLIGLEPGLVLTGRQIDELQGDALWRAAEKTSLFVEVDPNQKERVIRALRTSGNVVGFLGDGINDAPAMHAADTSLSVESAVDVAREAADFVLLERGLDVIRRGVEEGRRTFANTMKYVLMTTSANLGNMVSMAAASLFLPFRPLTAGQVLLNNFVSDIPAVGLAGDRVDSELVARPRRWDIGFIARYMTEFGVLSSAFDALTFGTLLFVFHAGAAVFQTSWFVESLLTELAMVLVMRTRRPFYGSRPGRTLLLSTLVLISVAFATPYLPGAGTFGFVPLPAHLSVAIAFITAAYVVATELQKKWFYCRTAD